MASDLHMHVHMHTCMHTTKKESSVVVHVYNSSAPVVRLGVQTGESLVAVVQLICSRLWQWDPVSNKVKDEE